MDRSSSSTCSAVRIGKRRSRPASSSLIRITALLQGATSGFKVITMERCPSATSASRSFRERKNAALGNDVPPVFHLGGLVRHDGDVSRSDAALYRPRDR